METAVVGTILVVSLTAGITNKVSSGDVFLQEMKTEITSHMQASVEVVSDNAISEQITEDGIYEAEMVTIYDAARQNAFQITLLAMTFMAFLALIMSQGLPAKKLV